MIGEIEREAVASLDSAPSVSDRASGIGAVDRIEVARVVFVALAAAAVWFHLWEPVATVDVVGIVATLVGGYPIFKEAFENVLERRMTMELSMTIALVAALAIGQAFTALVITAFVLAAEILEHLTVSRGRAAIGDLLRYLPRTALARRGETIVDVAVESLVPGERVLVNPGALVPVDGTVRAGHSFVDEARITGESMPAKKSPGDVAYAGTINGSGALEIDVAKLGRDTSFGRIVEAVESAERTRAPIERVADRLAGYLVYFALGAAVFTFALTRDVVATISVVIVAGACGVAAGTPLAVLGAIGRAARAGAIVKGGRYLEALARTSIVVFDKTGTLTAGSLAVTAIDPQAGVDATDLLRAAALAEMRSEHPLGRAIVAHAASRGIPAMEPDTFAYEPGRGILATHARETILAGNAIFLRERGFAIEAFATSGLAGEVALEALTTVYVARGARLLGAIRVGDTVRPEAARTIATLHRMGIRTAMLTGDTAAVAGAIARELAIDDVRAEMLPDDKRAFVAGLVATGATVVMVGDGINDAPALIAATVGVAMGSGTDVARESADIVLLGNDLARFVTTIDIARKTRAIVMQNFVGTIAVDAIGIVLAAIGVLSPLFAAFVHVTSELAFILNATRMLAPRASPQSRATGARTTTTGVLLE